MSATNNGQPIDNASGTDTTVQPSVQPANRTISPPIQPVAPRDMNHRGDEEAGNAEPLKPPPLFNVNSYATHKTLTAGAMDIALLTSNGNQLKMMAASEMTTIQIVTLVMLAISIFLQFVVVFLIIVMGSSNIDLSSREAEQEKAQKRLDRQNKSVLGMVAFITLINILASQVHASDVNASEEDG